MTNDRGRYYGALQDATRCLDTLTAQHISWSGPVPGSLAAEDDVVWPSAPPSDTVRNSVLSGAEHARLLIALLNSDQPWPPTVVYSTMRNVLVGGSQALWIAGCSEPARRRARALAVTREDYRLRRAHHDGQTRSQDPDRAAHAANWVERWDERIAALVAVIETLPKIGGLRLTGVIEWVGSDVLAGGSDTRAGLLATWQICSAYAHALPWGNFLVPGAAPIDPSVQGPTGFAVELDWEHAAGEALMCTQILLLAHRRLWEWAGRVERTPGPIAN